MGDFCDLNHYLPVSKDDSITRVLAVGIARINNYGKKDCGW